MITIQRLPTDLKTLVLEFLSIDDCFSLEKANSSFFVNLRLTNAFWSKKLFEKSIQNPLKSLNLFKFYESQTPYYMPTTSEFNNFEDAKLLWTEITSNQQDLQDSLEIVGSEGEKSQAFAQRIYSILADPPMPALSLKRETQYLETSSWFENFLTEIHFGITPPARFQDKDYVFLVDVCKVIQEDSSKLHSSFSKKMKTNSKKRARTDKGAVCIKRSRFSLVRGKEKTGLTFVEKRRQENFANKIEEVFHSVQQLVLSRCRTIRNYLSSLTQDKVILKEYKRCWKEYTYSMIEMNSLMEPFEGLFKSNGALQFQQKKMSIWREMVRVWIDEVYNNVTQKVKTSFEKVLTESIMQETGNLEEEEIKEKATRLLMKSFIALSDISLYKSDFHIHRNTSGSEMQPKFRLVSSIYPNIQKVIETTIVALDKEPRKLNKTLNDIQSVFNTVFNEEVSLEKVSKYSSDQGSGNLSNTDFEDLPEIAGQYRIVSRCKWENRLSSIYESIKGMSVF